MQDRLYRRGFVFGMVWMLVTVAFATVPINVSAEEPVEEDGWWVEGTGTYFEITNSSYFNITLTSNEIVDVFLESIPNVVSCHIESNCSATSTLLTFSGFEASKTYYLYQDGDLLEEFTTDETGSYSYIQNISTPHHVFTQEEAATIKIRSDGSVDPWTAPIFRFFNTYILTDNIYESIYIEKSGITLDGAGYTVSGRGYGLYLISRVSNVKIKNFNIEGFTYGIYLSGSDDNILTGNTISGNQMGVYLYYYCHGNRITGNTISGNGYGVNLRYSVYNRITGNTISGNDDYGVFLYRSNNNDITGNTISGNTFGVSLHYASSNTFHHNNIINSGYRQLYQFPFSSSNTWDNGAGEGNYWSDYTGLDDGSGGRTTGDGIGDTNLPHLGADYYPLMYPYSLTPAGTDVTIYSGYKVVVHFSNVTSPGNTYADLVEGSPPANFRLIPAQTFYKITTTASYEGIINISIPYNESEAPGKEEKLKLKYWNETIGDWVDITTWVDTVNNIIYGETTRLSIFAIMLKLNDPPEADAGGPYEANEGTEITFNASGSSDPDPDGDELQYRWDFDNDGIWDTEYSTEPTAAYTWYDDYCGEVVVEVYDGEYTDTATATVTVSNVAPTVTAVGDIIDEDGTATVSGTITDPGTPDTVTAVIDWGEGAPESFYYPAGTTSYSETHQYLDDNPTGTTYDDYAISVTVTDDDLGVGTASTIVTVHNVAPTANAGPDKVGDEPSTFTFTGSHTDPGTLDTHTYEWDFDYDGIIFDADATGNSVSNIWCDDFNGFVALRVTDDDGEMDTDTMTVTVNNVAPTIISITAPVEPVEVGTTITLIGTFTDPGMLDTHTATFYWGDTTYTEYILVEGDCIVTGSHTYDEAGVYTINLTVTDDDGGTDSMKFKYVVVYDPEDGFVTGGGWIDSPEGAYTPDLGLSGRANFGFVSKYKHGQQTPTGNTEFNFRVANMNFHSSSYEWLVIAGAKAMYKGTGTINNAGNYGFMISAIDEDLTPSTDVDMFRIKIWDKDNDDNIIYDNNIGDPQDADPTTILGGGQIKIHKN